MAEFGKWIKIEPDCEMPEESDEVLILLHDRGYSGSPCDVYEVDIGIYEKHVPYIWSLFPELGGFGTLFFFFLLREICNVYYEDKFLIIVNL